MRCKHVYTHIYIHTHICMYMQCNMLLTCTRSTTKCPHETDSYSMYDAHTHTYTHTARTLWLNYVRCSTTKWSTPWQFAMSVPLSHQTCPGKWCRYANKDIFVHRHIYFFNLNHIWGGKDPKSEFRCVLRRENPACINVFMYSKTVHVYMYTCRREAYTKTRYQRDASETDKQACAA